MKQVRFRGLLAILLTLLLLLFILPSCENKATQFENLIEQDDYVGALELYDKSIVRNAKLKEESNAFLTNHFMAKWQAFLEGELTDDAFSHVYEGVKEITEKHEIIPLFEEYSDHYETIKQSEVLFEEGLALIESDNLLKAIETFSQIESIEGTPYQEAQNQITELHERYREQVLTEASELIQDENYEEAIRTIEEAIVAVGDHESFSESLQEALALYREKILVSASQLTLDENYDQAIHVIEEAIDETGEHESFSQSLQEIFAHSLEEEIHNLYDAGDYVAAYKSYVEARLHPYFTEDLDLEEYALLARQAFIDETIEEAKAILGEEQNHVDAIKKINLAIAAVGEDPLLMQEYDYYQSFKPVLLSSLDYSVQDGYFYSMDYIEDNMAESYANVFYANEPDASRRHSRTILLDGQYTSMTGRVIVGYEDKDQDDVGEVSFYGDGELLFSSGPMGAGVAPIDFDIDVSDVQELEVVATSIAHGWGGYHPYLVDTMLNRH